MARGIEEARGAAPQVPRRLYIVERRVEGDQWERYCERDNEKDARRWMATGNRSHLRGPYRLVVFEEVLS